MKLLSRLGDPESLKYIQELAAAPSARYADVKDLLERTRVRVTALSALASLGHSATASGLCELWFEQPPQAEAFEGKPAANDLEAAKAERQAIVQQGVCEAILALPDGQALWDIAHDKSQAERLIDEIRALALTGARAIMSSPHLEGQTSLAIRALGRGGRFSSAVWEAIDLLAKEEVPLPTLRPAVADALASMASDRANMLLISMRARMEEQPALASQWYEVCSRLAARGLASDYTVVIQALDTLPEEVVRGIVGVMARRSDAPPDSYYELLARVAARPVLSEYAAPAELYASALGGVAQPAQTVPAAPVGPGGAELRRRHVMGGPAESRVRPVLRERELEAAQAMPSWAVTEVKPSGLRALRLPADAWLDDLEFRSQCLTLLSKGSDRVVGELLRSPDVKLRDHPVFGPWAVLTARQRGADINVVDAFSKRFDASVSLEDRCAVVALARKLGSADANRMLAEILLAKPGAEQKPPAGQEGRPAEEVVPGMPPRGVVLPPGMVLPGGLRFGQPEQERERARQLALPKPRQQLTPEGQRRVLMACVARALGSLGDYETLRKAVTYRYSKDSGLEFMYQPEVVLGSLDGMAYLPPDKEPVACLQRLNRLWTDPEMNRACADAMLEAWRLSRGSSGQPTEGRGT